MTLAPVAVLRPEPGNAATAQRIAAMGLPVLRLPLFVVEPVAWIPPPAEQFDAVVVTSANALRHGGPSLLALRGYRLFAVGAATARAARTLGFTVAMTGDADAPALLASIPKGVRLLHLAGVDHRMPADDRVVSRTVYRSVACAVPDRFDQVVGGTALLHSPRAAARFAAIVDARPIARAHVAIAALSDAVRAAAGDGWRSVAVAERPNDDALCATLGRLTGARSARISGR